MSGIGLYLARSSPVHRLPAGVKLLALVGAAVGSVGLHRAWQVGLALVGVVLLYAVARIPWRSAVEQVRPLAWFVGALLLFQAAVSGWERAVVVVGGLVALVLLAALVSLTTRTSDIVDVVVATVRPLRRLGIDPERLGLLVALGIRAVPVMVDLAREVRQAQLARGGASSPSAFVVPLVVRALRHADRLAEALVARGVDD